MGIDETENQDQDFYDLDQMANNTKTDVARASSWLALLHVLIQPLKSLEKSFACRCAAIATPIRHAQGEKHTEKHTWDEHTTSGRAYGADPVSR